MLAAKLLNVTIVAILVRRRMIVDVLEVVMQPLFWYVCVHEDLQEHMLQWHRSIDESLGFLGGFLLVSFLQSFPGHPVAI